MEAALLALAGWLEAAGVGAWARGAAWVYPAANVVHLLGLVMLVGGIGIVDLRILGLWRGLPLAALSRALTPVAVVGLGIQVASGLVLFVSDAKALAASPIFQLKLLLIALALTNAVLFRLAWGSGAGSGARGGKAVPAAPARLSAAASLLLWLAVGAAGRLIAYY